MLKYRSLCAIARCFKLAAKSRDTSCANNILAFQARGLHKCTFLQEGMSRGNYPEEATVKLMRKAPDSETIYTTKREVKYKCRAGLDRWFSRKSLGSAIVKIRV